MRGNSPCESVRTGPDLTARRVRVSAGPERPQPLAVAPRSQIAHLPGPALGPAGCPLQPRFAATFHEAREKVPARDPVLTVERGERRDRATRPRPWVFPRHTAGALAQDLAHGGARHREVALGGHLRG